MSKNALIILAQGFEEIEAITVIDLLRRTEIAITIAGLTDLKVKGAHGITILVDKKLKDIKDTFDAYILPGGMPGTTNLALSKELKALLSQANKESKVIAAICAAPALVLSRLGILDGKAATCYEGMQSSFSEKTKYKSDPVVIDGNIITSRSPATAMVFALAIVNKLLGENVVLRLKQAILLP